MAIEFFVWFDYIYLVLNHFQRYLTLQFTLNVLHSAGEVEGRLGVGNDVLWAPSLSVYDTMEGCSSEQQHSSQRNIMHDGNIIFLTVPNIIFKNSYDACISSCFVLQIFRGSYLKWKEHLCRMTQISSWRTFFRKVPTMHLSKSRGVRLPAKQVVVGAKWSFHLHLSADQAVEAPEVFHFQIPKYDKFHPSTL